MVSSYCAVVVGDVRDEAAYYSQIILQVISALILAAAKLCYRLIVCSPHNGRPRALAAVVFCSAPSIVRQTNGVAGFVGHTLGNRFFPVG